ncbi:MAG: porin family protein [Prevotellaceae bacterium]|jgi:outer membrane protein W|nr:porin family protein [Prevotellaceae bacterium]
MKKVIFTAILAISTAVSVNAQWKAGADLGIQIPIGTFGDAYNLGVGGTVAGEYLVTESIGAGLQLGYFSFGGKEIMGIETGSMSVVPITATGKYYFLREGFKPYAGLDLGFYVLSFESPDLFGLGSITVSETKFGLAPVLGLQYEFSDNWALDGNLKYNYVTASGDALSTFGINVGIVYTIE